MALLKSKKAEMVKELGKIVKDSSALVFVNFHGLKAGDETTLRRELRKEKVSYKVFRKTLLKRALEGKAEGTLPDLSGEVAVAYGLDQIAPAREIYNFQKNHKVALGILGGVFENKFVDSGKMMEIATIPPREVLLSKLAFLLQSPMQRLAIALNEVSKSRTQ